MYWDINKILPYQRQFNFINGPRSIGKTYTTLKWLINRYIKKYEEFVYITRTMTQKNNGVLELSLQKVIDNEFPEWRFKFSKGYGEINNTLFCHCISLSEAVKVKVNAYPNVRYIIFDEYMIEEGVGSRYVNGWREPDSFLSIYHTIDREEDRVKCFLLGNNTNFYNPYHIHEAFKIKPVQPGQIYIGKNVLYQWAMPSEELQKKKTGNKFLEMITDSEYADYAVQGNYMLDNMNQISKRSGNEECACVIEIGKIKVGCWHSKTEEKIIISTRYNEQIKQKYTIYPEDIRENWSYFIGSPHYYMYKVLIKKGIIYYEDMEIKSKCSELQKILIRS